MCWGAADRTTAERIGVSECLQLLGGGQVGRLAYVEAGAPVVAHVPYRVVEGALVIRSAAAGVLAAAQRGARAALEVDDDRAACGGTWVVEVHGSLSAVVAPDETHRLDALWFTPALDDPGARYVRLTLDEVSGERRRHEPAQATLLLDDADVRRRPLRSRIPPD